jgi:hypothetical protein
MQLTGEKHFSGKGMRSLESYETATLFHAPAALNVEPSQTEGTCPIIVVELFRVTAPDSDILNSPVAALHFESNTAPVLQSTVKSSPDPVAITEGHILSVAVPTKVQFASVPYDDLQEGGTSPNLVPNASTIIPSFTL